MKLSANAREWVAKSVKDALGARLKDAQKAYNDEIAARRAKWEDWESSYAKLEERFKKDVAALLERKGLTFDDAEYAVASVKPFATDAVHGYFSPDTFAETKVRAYRNAVLDGLTAEIDAARDEIKAAVGRALFEIEVHGRKDTLESIVSEVVESIMKERK